MNEVDWGVGGALGAANYSYLANSDLIEEISSSAGLASLREYEPNRNLLTAIENEFDSQAVSRYDYANDAGGRRVSVVQTGAAFDPVGDIFNRYQYAANKVQRHSEACEACARNNSRSEVIDAVRYFGSDTNDSEVERSLLHRRHKQGQGLEHCGHLFSIIWIDKVSGKWLSVIMARPLRIQKGRLLSQKDP